MKYQFISDPGHGWLKVSIKELVELDLLDKITHYSYMNLKSVYLEEDLDRLTFLNRKKELGQKVEINEKNVDVTSIRSMKGFDKKLVNFCLGFGIGDEILLYKSSTKEYNEKAIVSHIDKTNVFVISDDGNRYKISKSNFLTYMKPLIDNYKTYESKTDTNVKLTVRIVEKNDRYGLDFSIISDKDEPTIEFYDKRYNHTIYGQFISRYYLKTIMNVENEGLLLDTGSKDWTINKENLDILKEQIKNSKINFNIEEVKSKLKP